jgi:hypothetical protein
VGAKVIIYSNHTTLKNLLTKKDAKPRLVRWILLLQEFDLEIKDRKELENLVTHHLSQMQVANLQELPKNDFLRDDMLLKVMDSNLWYMNSAGSSDRRSTKTPKNSSKGVRSASYMEALLLAMQCPSTTTCKWRYLTSRALTSWDHSQNPMRASTSW